MGFKIADAYVAVDPKDDNFEVGLRRIVENAAAKVEAKVSAGLREDAPGSLREDLDVALELATDRLDANVGLGLHNDAVEELDADVKAGVKLVEDNNKIKLPVDSKSAQQAGMSLGMKVALGFGLGFGPGVLTEAVVGGIPLMLAAAGSYLASNSPEVQAAFSPLEADVVALLASATGSMVPAAKQALGQLDSLVAAETPRIAGYFQQTAPSVEILTSGIGQFVTNLLPGFDAAVAQSTAVSRGFAAGLGLAGDGLGHLITGLSAGAGGGAQDFVETMRLLDAVLAVLGTDLGKLANGAEPVLQKLEPVLAAVASDLAGATTSTILTGLDVANSILTALPVDVVRAIADATAAWFAASKVYGIVAGAGPLLVSAASKVNLLSDAQIKAAGGADALGASWGKTLGALSLLLTGAGLLGQELGKLAGVGDHTAGNVDQLVLELDAAAQGSTDSRDAIEQYTLTMLAMSNATHGTVDGMKSLDQALAQLAATNPQEAADEFDKVTTALKGQGATAQQVAAFFPAYSKTVEEAKLQQQLARSSTDGLTEALDIEQQKLLLVMGAYDSATSAANAFKNKEDALYGKYADYSQAQANLTEQIASATGQITKGTNAINLHTGAGAKNFTLLNQLAQANEQVAEALIKQGGTSDQATASLQKGAQAIDDLARKSGFTDKQIQQLNIDLYGVPSVKDITFRANTTPVIQALNGLIQRIDSSSGTIQVYANVHNPAGGKALLTNADGGPVQRGDVSVVGERGPEIVVFGAAGRVVPNEAIRTVGGTSSNATGAALGMTIHTLNVTIPMQGIVDFTDPNNMTVQARRMAVNISNALNQVTNSRTGAR